MGAMSASDAAPLPRLGEVFFDVRGSSRSMRLSWYADTGVAVLSIWQGGMCTGTFRLAIDDLPRMVETLQRGPDGQRARPPAPARPGLGEVPADATAGAPAVGPLPGGGLPDYDFAHAGYQAGPAARPRAGPGTAHRQAEYRRAVERSYPDRTYHARRPGSTRRSRRAPGRTTADSRDRPYGQSGPPARPCPLPAHEVGRPRTGPYLPAPAHGPPSGPAGAAHRPGRRSLPGPRRSWPGRTAIRPSRLTARAGYPADMPARISARRPLLLTTASLTDGVR